MQVDRCFTYSRFTQEKDAGAWVAVALAREPGCGRSGVGSEEKFVVFISGVFVRRLPCELDTAKFVPCVAEHFICLQLICINKNQHFIDVKVKNHVKIKLLRLANKATHSEW